MALFTAKSMEESIFEESNPFMEALMQEVVSIEVDILFGDPSLILSFIKLVEATALKIASS